MKKLNIITAGILLGLFANTAVNCYADTPLSGSKKITLLDSNNQALTIGNINFSDDNGRVSYKISLDGEVFRDEFLSMRPFQCIRLDEKMICHLSYPYPKQGYIAHDDLIDLEYDLLFLHKAPGEYGINAWNGLYYDLSITGNNITGTLNEVDLNVLAAPPEDGVLRPVTADMLHEADPERHLFPTLRIQ